MHRHKPNCHKAHERSHTLPINDTTRFYCRPHRRPIVSNLIHPFRVHILVPAPPILEFRPGSETVWSGMEIARLVERRICGDQMHGPGVHPPEEIQIVSVIERAVFEVGLCHCFGFCLRVAGRLLSLGIGTLPPFGGLGVLRKIPRNPRKSRLGWGCCAVSPRGKGAAPPGWRAGREPPGGAGGVVCSRRWAWGERNHSKINRTAQGDRAT